MPLSDDDETRIEEEEYPKHVQARLQANDRVDIEDVVATHSNGK